MKPWMLALIAAVKRKLMVVGPYTASRTFIAPLTTSKIESITGKGQDGRAGYYETSTTPIKRGTIYYTYLHRRDGGPDDVITSVDNNYWNGDPSLTVKPADYCDPYKADPDSTVYHGSTQCRVYAQSGGDTTTTYVPPTTGASTTAFGRTFPGGAGGPASVTTHTNIPVEGGLSYPLTIPTGGNLSFTYYE